MLNPLKLYAAVALLVVLLSGLGWAGWTVHGWHRDAQRLPAVEAERDAARAETASVRAEAERERIRADQAVRGYVDEVESLRRRQRGPVQPVRLCVQPATAGVPAASSPAERADGAAPAAGIFQGPAGGGPDVWTSGPDIGPALRAIADDADAVTARCRALQGWLRSAGTP